MGVELLEIGVKVRKGVIFTIGGCFRLICSHPFLAGILCFLIFLYRLSPFLFQLLVSASPVLVCTAVLLGTLLSFGQPNIPEIEVEEKTTFEAVSIKTSVSGETAVVEKNESYFVERLSERRWDETEQSTEGKLGGVRMENSDDNAPLIEERSPATEVNEGEICEESRELGDLRYEQKTDWIEERLNNSEVMENHFSLAEKVNDELVKHDDGKSEADSFDSEKVNVDSLDSPPLSPWTRVEERENKVAEEDEEDEEDGSDSGSSRAESSSPDASMADIMPMLDELHPLLDEVAPQIVHRSRGGSDVASEKSAKSHSSNHESDGESENSEDLEVADDENEDGDKEGQTKSPISWTEEDQKNLMDLGSSEIERNQRLENLILRRRARKKFADMNLIDLDGVDLPFSIAPISTRRQNPFDLPHDHYDDSGLPPIPGSAPSVLLQRQNPFDIPYDSSEEKPDLMGDGFKEEFTSQPREPIFRRHESFHVGPSKFAPKRKDVNLRPYFVPEGSISEESSSSLFRRQLSELSDSKLSSVPDTESISSVTSVEDQEDRKLLEEDNLPEVEVIAKTNLFSEEGPSGHRELSSKQEISNEEDGHQEPETISKMESISEHVGHGSQSSEEEDSLDLGQVEKSDVKAGELEPQQEDVVHHYEQGVVTGYGSSYKAPEQRLARDSSSSSLSEESERVFTMTEGEGLMIWEGRGDVVAEEAIISTQTSVETTDLNITSMLINNIPHGEPVYDTSPRELSKNVSSASTSPDLHSESDIGPVIDKRTMSSVEVESEGISQGRETDIHSNVEMLPDPSVDNLVNESSRIDVDTRQHDNIHSDLSGGDQISFSEGSSAAAGFARDMSILLKLSDDDSGEEHLLEQRRLDEIPVSSTIKNIGTMAKSSEGQILENAQENFSLPSGGENVSEVNEPDFEGQLSAEHSVGMGEISNSDGGVCHEADEKLMCTPSSEGNAALFHDEAVNESNCMHLNEGQASSTAVESFVDGQGTQEMNMPEVQQPDHYIASNIRSPMTPEIISSPPIVEVDEIKEIDDAFLSELDNVGDFSIQQLGSGSNEFEKHGDYVGEEGLASLHPAESSTTRDVDVEVRSVELNKLEDALYSENSREHTAIYEEGVECSSELQTSKTSRDENTKVSRMEFDENDCKDSPCHETSGEEILFPENEVQPGHPLVSLSFEDTLSPVPELEVQTIEDVDAVPLEKVALSLGTETIGGGSEVSSQGQVNTDTTSGMPEVEASKLEDIDLAFKEIISEEIEKPVVFKPPQAEFHNDEETVSALPESEQQFIGDGAAVPQKAEFTYVETDTETLSEMPELVASRIEDIDQAFMQLTLKEIEKPFVSDLPEAELHNGEDIVSRMPELEIQSIEHVDAVIEKAEQTSVDTDAIVGGGDVKESSQGPVDTVTTSRMTELEASVIEDSDLAFKETSSTKIEKRVVLEPPEAEPHNHEDTVSGIPPVSEVRSIEETGAVSQKDGFTSSVIEIVEGVVEVSSQAHIDSDATSGMTELEASTIEDINLAFKQISSDEIEKSVALEPPKAELAVGEAVIEDSEDGGDSRVTISTHEKSVCEVGRVNHATLDPDSVDRVLHVAELGETQGTSAELHVVKSIPLEDTISPSNQALDAESMEQLKPNSDDGSVEVKADKVGQSEEGLSVTESSAFSAENPEHKVEAPKEVHSPSSEGKTSKSSSSSSSSSSESSSSDSDRE